MDKCDNQALIGYTKKKKESKRREESLKIQSDKHSVSYFKSKGRSVRGNYLWDYVKAG